MNRRIIISGSTFILIAFICIGFILRFYNIDWGDPFYFHPDERNVASSISQLVFPEQFNPHFFAYGSLPIYLVFFLGLIVNLFRQTTVSFQQAIILMRVFAAALSVFIIPSIFYITKKITDNKTAAVFAAGLSTFSVGFIQFAHFGTFEMWLTFLGLWLFYFCYKITKYGDFTDTIVAGILSGLLVGTKISGLVLVPIPFICILYFAFSKKKYFTTGFLESAMHIFTYCFFLGAVYLLTNPYVLLDTKSFLDSMHYETTVATGTLPVFYTGEFFNSKPVLFQLLHVYPFLLNPFVTVIFVLSFFYTIFTAIKTRKQHLVLLLVFFVLLFFSQAILFAKWTRYMLPTLPFVYLIISIPIFDIVKGKYMPKFTILSLTTCFIVIGLIYGFLYTYVAYGREDTRLAALDFAKTSVPFQANILSEVYDLGIVPFNSSYPHISLFNFYDLDNNGTLSENDLKTALSQSDYIILPSQRILKPRLLNTAKFPNASMFYQSLFNGSLGYRQIYQTPCDILCKVVYLNDPVFSLEETATVFDRPTLYIFKKIQ